VLWLDAAKGITQVGGVTVWADQSPDGNNATGGTNALPGYVTSDINGLPGLRFTGGSYLSVGDSASLRFGTGDFLVEVVASWTNTPIADLTTGYGLIFSKQVDSTAPYYGVGMFANYPAPSPNTALGVQTNDVGYVLSASTGLNDGNARLVAIQRVGSTVSVRINGAMQAMRTTSSADDCDATGFPLYIGAQPRPGTNIQQLTGDIAEIVAVKGTTSASDLQSLEAYLTSKYKL
jgi:hypothetical protein